MNYTTNSFFFNTKYKTFFSYHINLQHCIIDFYLLQVRDELAQLLEDDDDMADLYLSRKASIATLHFDENDVEELEQLLEVITFFTSTNLEWIFHSSN